MKTVLVLSAHLDDAAFSVGPLLAEWADDARVIVATLFTQSVLNPEGFALACQLDKGLPASVDYMQIRRDEDLKWSEKMGVVVVHGPFCEAPHRGYHSAKALFEPIILTDEIAADLRPWLQDLIDSHSPDLVLLPLGIGNHVDHQWVRKVVETTLPSRDFLVYYKDQPYAEKSGSSVAHTQPSDHGPWHEFQVSLGQDALKCAHAATEAYETQISFQFGSAERMKEVLSSAWGSSLTLFHTAEIPTFIKPLLNTTSS